jgi:hypothetical protein
MGVTDRACPVCGNNDACEGEDPQGREAIKFWCRTVCDMFVMSNGFFTNEWPNVSDENKEAMSVYLRNRKKPVDLSVVITEDNYKCYVKKGKKLLRLAASS